MTETLEPRIMLFSVDDSSWSLNSAGNQLNFHFDSPATVDASAITMVNNTTGVTLPASAISFSYDSDTQNATVTFPGAMSNFNTAGVLATGKWTFSLPSSAVTDSDGDNLDDDFNTSLSALPGDFNGDGVVNTNDLNILRSHMGETSATYADGDLNGDGVVDSSDFIAFSPGQRLADPPADANHPTISDLAPADTSLTLNWLPITPAAGKTIANYRIQRNINGGTFVGLITLPNNQYSYTDTGLNANTTYGYRIRLIYTDTTTSGWTVPATATTALGAPSNLIATPISSGTGASLNWIYPGSVPDLFYVEYDSTDGTFAGVSPISIAGNQRTATITGLDPSKSYNFILWASSTYQHTVSPIAMTGETGSSSGTGSNPDFVSSGTLFNYVGTEQLIQVQFTQDVSASLAALASQDTPSLHLEDATTGTDMPDVDVQYQPGMYDSVHNEAFWLVRDAASNLPYIPDDWYVGTIDNQDVHNSAGYMLSQDITIQCPVLRGSYDMWNAATASTPYVPTSVNVGDEAYNRANINMGMSNATYLDGDFNYNGLVQLDDRTLSIIHSGTSKAAPPSSPGSLVLSTGATNNSIAVDWMSPTAPSGLHVVSYRLQRSPDGNTFTTILDDGALPAIADQMAQADSDLADGTRYWYRVRAMYSNGTTSAYTPKKALTTPLLPVTSLTATATDATHIALAWSAGSSNATGYNILYKPHDDSDPTPANATVIPLTLADIGSGANPAYTITKLTPGTTYDVWVQATNSWMDAAYVPTGTTSLPSVPTHLYVAPTSQTSVHLAWQYPSSGQTLFRVYAAKGSDPFTLVATSENDAEADVDNLDAGATYRFYVKAETTNGTQSAPTPTVTTATVYPVGYSLNNGALSVQLGYEVGAYLHLDASGLAIYDNSTGTGTPLTNVSDPFTSLAVNIGGNEQSATLEVTGTSVSLGQLTSNTGLLNITGSGAITIGNIDGTGGFQYGHNSSGTLGGLTINGDVNLGDGSGSDGQMGYFANFGNLTVNGNVSADEFDASGTTTVDGNVTIDNGGDFNNIGDAHVTGNLSPGEDINNGGYDSPGATLEIDGDATPGRDLNNGWGSTLIVHGDASPGRDFNNAGSTATIDGNVAAGEDLNSGATNFVSSGSPGFQHDADLTIFGNAAPEGDINNGSVRDGGLVSNMLVYGDITPLGDLNNLGILTRCGAATPGGTIENTGTILPVDLLGVDSDNDDGLTPDPHVPGDAVDVIEDDPTQPGKLIPVGDTFVPVSVSVPDNIDLTKATFQFTYDASDPSATPQPPPTGTFRLWDPNALAGNPVATDISAGGDFIASGSSFYPATDWAAIGITPTHRSTTLYIEAVNDNPNQGKTVTFRLNPTGVLGDPFTSDTVRVTAGVDLEIDSNNDGTIDPAKDGPIKNDEGKAGKLIQVDDGDVNGDGIPDYAEGFGFSDTTGNGGVAGDHFTPITLTVPQHIPADATVSFSYSASNPDDVIRTGAGTNDEPYVYAAATGALRLWKLDGPEFRTTVIDDPSATDYIAPGAEFKLADLGVSPGQTVTLYLEGIHASPSGVLGDQIVQATLTFNSHAVNDQVRATTYPGLIRADANRDGSINFVPTNSSQSDRTSSARPYRFWINNDDDGSLTSDNEVYTYDPDFRQDSGDDSIASTRDQEDFARLVVRPPPGYDPQDSTWQIQVGLSDGNSQSGIALRFLRVTEAQGVGYLTDPAIDLSSSLVTPIVHAGDTVDISAARNAITRDGEINILFEGVTTGAGKFTVRFLHSAAEVASDSVDINLVTIRSMYEDWTVGDTVNWGDPKSADWQLPTHASLTADSGHYTAQSTETNDVIVFVHGWRMQTTERRSYAETAYKRLYWQGFKGRFIAYNWPTQWVNLDGDWFTTIWNALGDQGNFGRSEEIAFNAAAGLANLLRDLHQEYGTKGGKISIFAHSMGNMVTGEALRQLAEANAGKIVDTYVMTQAAMGADAYMGADGENYPSDYAGYLGGSNPWFRHIDDAAAKVVNFYNPDDHALNLWDIGNGSKIDLNAFQSASTLDSAIPGFDARYTYHRATATTAAYYDRDSDASGSLSQISFATNPYEMFSYIARDERPPIGRLSGVGGPITADVDLRTLIPNIMDDHSGQWDSDIIATRGYWRALMSQFGLAVNP